MLHRILDDHGTGVELDDRNPEHRLWAVNALARMKAPSTHPLRVALELFIERAARTDDDRERTAPCRFEG